jgi:hypothetical protein
MPSDGVAAAIETEGAAAVAELNCGAAGAFASPDSDALDDAEDFLPRKLNLGQNCDELIVEQPTSDDKIMTAAQ